MRRFTVLSDISRPSRRAWALILRIDAVLMLMPAPLSSQFRIARSTVRRSRRLSPCFRPSPGRAKTASSMRDRTSCGLIDRFGHKRERSSPSAFSSGFSMCRCVGAAAKKHTSPGPRRCGLSPRNSLKLGAKWAQNRGFAGPNPGKRGERG